MNIPKIKEGESLAMWRMTMEEAREKAALMVNKKIV